MTDFSQPQRMSKSAFVIILLNTFRALIGVLFFYAIIGISKSESADSTISILLRALVLLGVGMGIAAIIALGSYLTKKFYIKDGSLIFSHGLFRRENLTIPLDRIHSLRTKRGLFYRLCGMRGIVFDTLASKAAEVELILDEADWQNMLKIIERGDPGLPPDLPEDVAAHNPTIRFSNKALVLDGLCQNHLKGFAILFGFLAVIYDRINDFTDNAVDTITDYTVSHFDISAITLPGIIGAVAGLYILVALLWLGKVVMRYYDMTLTVDKKNLTFDRGLFSRTTNRFSPNKVCTIWVKRNFPEKRFGLCTMMLKQAINVTAEKEDDILKVYGKDFSGRFLQWWLGADYAASAEIASAKSGRGVMLHEAWRPFVVALAATLILCHFDLFSWTVLPMLYLMVMLLKGFCAMRRSRIALRESYILIDNGSFAEISNYIKYDNIQVARICRTPLTRWSHRVTLRLSTSGTTFNMRSLKEKDARLIYELLMWKAERGMSPSSGL